jgi:hypothetical protein
MHLALLGLLHSGATTLDEQQHLSRLPFLGPR